MNKKHPETGTAKPLWQLPRGVWALGFVSLFMDMSSEMIHSLLPVFLATVLGASPVFIGFIEGLGEAVTPISKLFSGWASDRLGKRKPFALFGYGLAMLSKPLFALAATPLWVLTARVVDRFGKGVRGAPRDALVADLTPASQRGAAYGLRQSLDSVGAFVGPLLALGLMALLHNNFRQVFWIAAIPAIACVATLAFFVREPGRHQTETKPGLPLRWTAVRALGPRFWAVSGIGTLLTLARFSEAFLILRAQGTGLAITLVPLVLIVMNVVYALSAYPVGAMSDRVGRPGLLTGGFGILIIADLILGFGTTLWSTMVGIAFWGLHMGMTQGLLATLVADTANEQYRGSAFGVFNFIIGLATLVASVLAGYLWQTVGPAATFFAGAGFTVLGVGAALVFRLAPRKAER